MKIHEYGDIIVCSWFISIVVNYKDYCNTFILNFNIISLTDRLDVINEEIKNYLKSNFNISEQTDEYINYIFELYDIKYDLISQINGKFNYKINMYLKWVIILN